MILLPSISQRIVHRNGNQTSGRTASKWAIWRIESGTVILPSSLLLELNKIRSSLCANLRSFSYRQVNGELFAHTSRFYPFNGASNESDNSISKESLREETSVEFNPSNVVLQRLKERILRYIFLDQSFA